MRVGFRPTPCRRSSEPGRSVAAARKGAADEKSPGTSSESGESRSAGHTVATGGLRSTRAPAPASIRSVWSRLGAGSTTVVGPPAAYSPASSTHDLTWALATGLS